MEEKIKKLYSMVSSVMLQFDEVNKAINSIEDNNAFNILLKSRLKEYSNSALSSLLVFSDLTYQLLDTCDSDEMELILRAFDEFDEEEYNG